MQLESIFEAERLVKIAGKEWTKPSHGWTIWIQLGGFLKIGVSQNDQMDGLFHGKTH